MKQYDNIMVPADEKEVSPHFIAGGMWKAEKNVIVLTVEELREVFRAGQEFQRQGPDRKTFTEFLQSKGIQI